MRWRWRWRWNNSSVKSPLLLSACLNWWVTSLKIRNKTSSLTHTTSDMITKQQNSFKKTQPVCVSEVLCYIVYYATSLLRICYYYSSSSSGSSSRRRRRRRLLITSSHRQASKLQPALLCSALLCSALLCSALSWLTVQSSLRILLSPHTLSLSSS